MDEAYKLVEVDKESYLHQYKIEHHFDKDDEFVLRDEKIEDTLWLGFDKKDSTSKHVVAGDQNSFKADTKGTYTIYLKEVTEGEFSIYIDCEEDEIVYTAKVGEKDAITLTWSEEHSAFSGAVKNTQKGELVKIFADGEEVNYVRDSAGNNNIDSNKKIRSSGDVTLYYHTDNTLWVSGYEIEDRQVTVTGIPELFDNSRTYCVWAYGGTKADAFYAATFSNHQVSATIPGDSSHFIVVILKEGETEYSWDNKDIQSRNIPLEDDVDTYTYDEPVPPLPEGYVEFTIQNLPNWWKNDCLQAAYIESVSEGNKWLTPIINETTAIVQAPSDTSKIVLVRFEKGVTPSWDDMTKVYNQSGDILISEGVTVYDFVSK